MMVQFGDVVEGTVQSFRPYGAFVDLGEGVVGLLHISQISRERIIGIESIFHKGDFVKVWAGVEQKYCMHH
jgi:small subunit ribosomal protein S1